MARALSTELDAIMVDATKRKPSWKVEIYDVRSTADTINTVVRNIVNSGTPVLQALTGPRDFTPDAVSVQVDERRGDYVHGGVTATTVTVNLIDEHGLFDPFLLIGLNPASSAYADAVGRYLRAGNVVTLQIGDSRVDQAIWPRIFTGEIVGQAGRARSRSDGARSTMTVRALSREARFSQFERTSNDFTIGQTFLQTAATIAQDEMGLDADEVDLSGWGSFQIAHTSVQFVEETPISMLAKLMFADGFLPKFDGRGVLTQISSTITGAADRIYEDLDVLRQIDRPFSDIEQPNCVTVVGLDGDMTKVSQPLQLLATTNITTGYFANDEEIDVFWSDDKTTVAEDEQARVIRSVNGGISLLGGEEVFTFIPSPGPGGGFIGVKITINTGFAPWLATFFLVTYVILAAIPDEVLSVFTIPVGRIVQALALGAAAWILTKIGRGQYEFLGSPIEWVYKELRGRACVNGASAFERNTIEIENHLLNTQAMVDNAARDTLLLLQAEENPRTANTLHDLKLEPDDIFEIPGDRLFLINSVTYTLIRNSARYPRATLGAFEITPGVVA